MSLVATTTVNGWLNAGTVDQLLLVTGCPNSRHVVAILSVIDGPGSLCIVPDRFGVMATADCGVPSPKDWAVETLGYDNTATCTSDPVAVTPQSWGGLHALYR
jgi:hypothetical protein